MKNGLDSAVDRMKAVVDEAEIMTQDRTNHLRNRVEQIDQEARKQAREFTLAKLMPLFFESVANNESKVEISIANEYSYNEPPQLQFTVSGNDFYGTFHVDVSAQSFQNYINNNIQNIETSTWWYNFVQPMKTLLGKIIGS